LEEVENKLGNLLIDRSIDSLQEVKVSLMKELCVRKMTYLYKKNLNGDKEFGKYGFRKVITIQKNFIDTLVTKDQLTLL
jgi:hypothetical protein